MKSNGLVEQRLSACTVPDELVWKTLRIKTPGGPSHRKVPHNLGELPLEAGPASYSKYWKNIPMYFLLGEDYKNHFETQHIMLFFLTRSPLRRN